VAEGIAAVSRMVWVRRDTECAGLPREAGRPTVAGATDGELEALRALSRAMLPRAGTRGAVRPQGPLPASRGLKGWLARRRRRHGPDPAAEEPRLASGQLPARAGLPGGARPLGGSAPAPQPAGGAGARAEARIERRPRPRPARIPAEAVAVDAGRGRNAAGRPAARGEGAGPPPSASTPAAGGARTANLPPRRMRRRPARAGAPLFVLLLAGVAVVFFALGIMVTRLAASAG
jgi:hypothetical protein